jgi:Flp pilus assembly protein TadB
MIVLVVSGGVSLLRRRRWSAVPRPIGANAARNDAGGARNLQRVILVLCAAMLVLRKSPGMFLAVAFTGALAVAARRIANKRTLQQQFHNDLPAFAEEVARRLRGGLGIIRALSDSADAVGPQFHTEFAPWRNEIELGENPSVVFRRWANALSAKTPNRGSSLMTFAMMLSIGEATGGVHAHALDGLAGVLRDQSTANTLIDVQSSQARLSALVLGCAPFLFSGLLVLGDARSSHFLFHHPIGIGCAVLGILLDLIGAFWMMRTARKATAR